MAISKNLMRRLATIATVVGMSVALSGCVIAPWHPGYCYYHPHRCR
jgi:hypothetical protein